MGPAPITKFDAVDANAMNLPVLEIDDSELAPSAGVCSSGVDIKVVLAVQIFVRQVLRS